MFSTKPKCNRVIRPNKYEKNAPEISSCWHKLFNLIESDAAIPPYRRKEVLQNIFPDKIIHRILHILGHEITDKKPLLEDPPKKGPEPKKPKRYQPSCSDNGIIRKDIGPKNPYTTFFKRRPDRAAIWHPLPPLSRDEMNLTQKAEAITETIATDFVNWMWSITDEDAPPEFTIPEVLKMFEIGFDTHAARTLQVNILEFASVPDTVALARNHPEMARRNQLHRQLDRDLLASKQKKQVFAFGSKIDNNLQIHPPNAAEIRKWLTCERVPVRIQSMATVFQGITHLKSTKAYCQFLLEHPKVQPPQYLIDTNMMNPATLSKQEDIFEQVFEVSSDISFGSSEGDFTKLFERPVESEI